MHGRVAYTRGVVEARKSNDVIRRWDEAGVLHCSSNLLSLHPVYNHRYLLHDWPSPSVIDQASNRLSDGKTKHLVGHVSTNNYEVPAWE